MTLVPTTNHGGIAIIVVNAIVGFFAVSAVILRIWARSLKNLRLDGSDWTCMLGLVFAFGLFASLILDITQALGRDSVSVTSGQLQAFFQSVLAGLFLWTTSVMFIRISAVLLFIRVFPLPKFVAFCWVVIALNVAYTITTYVAGCLMCQPISYTWNANIPGGRCGNWKVFYLWHGIQNLVHDLIVIIMPMPLLWTLHLPFFKKVTLTVVFAMGSIICAVTIGRIVETHNGRISHITQDYISVSLLTMLEPLLGTICCTLPLLRPVAQKIFAVCGRGSVLNSERHSSGPSVEMKRVQRRVVGPYSLGTMTDVPSENNSQINLHVLTDDHSACGLTELERVRIR